MPSQPCNDLLVTDDDVPRFLAAEQGLEDPDGRSRVGQPDPRHDEAKRPRKCPRQRQQGARSEERCRHADEDSVREPAHPRLDQTYSLHEHHSLQVAKGQEDGPEARRKSAGEQHLQPQSDAAKNCIGSGAEKRGSHHQEPARSRDDKERAHPPNALESCMAGTTSNLWFFGPGVN